MKRVGQDNPLFLFSEVLKPLRSPLLCTLVLVPIDCAVCLRLCGPNGRLHSFTKIVLISLLDLLGIGGQFKLYCVGAEQLNPGNERWDEVNTPRADFFPRFSKEKNRADLV